MLFTITRTLTIYTQELNRLCYVMITFCYQCIRKIGNRLQPIFFLFCALIIYENLPPSVYSNSPCADPQTFSKGEGVTVFWVCRVGDGGMRLIFGYLLMQLKDIWILQGGDGVLLGSVHVPIITHIFFILFCVLCVWRLNLRCSHCPFVKCTCG